MYPCTYKFHAPASMKERVTEMQAILSEMPQYEPVTKHYFHGGMYCREVYRDAGVMVVGKVHKHEHFYVIASGTVLVTTEDGAKELTAPAVVLSTPGTKRAVYAVTPATCMTFHRSNATTVEEAEAELIEEDPLSLFDAHNRVKLEVLQ